VKRAEECARLAGACTAEPNRQILIYAAVHGECWPKMLQPVARPRSGLNLTSPTPRATAQEREARGVRTPTGRSTWQPVHVSWLLAA
jgi:hypothetical protein